MSFPGLSAQVSRFTRPLTQWSPDIKYNDQRQVERKALEQDASPVLMFATQGTWFLLELDWYNVRSLHLLFLRLILFVCQ